eukprot:s575_g39.t1
MKDVFHASTAALEDSYDSEQSISVGMPETSHELGAPAESEPEGSTDEELEERHGDHAANQIQLGFEQEKQAKRELHMSQEATVPRSLKRRTGWKILKVFTWTCLLSRLADSWGWQFCEPHTTQLESEQAV